VAKSRIPKKLLRPRVTAPAALPPVPVAMPTVATRNRGAAARLRPSDPEFWTVINEIADPTPIVPAELDAIERYFSAVLNAVFDSSRKSSF